MKGKILKFHFLSIIEKKTAVNYLKMLSINFHKNQTEQILYFEPDLNWGPNLGDHLAQQRIEK